MSCKFHPHPELCGHKVCEDDYELTQEEIDEIRELNEETERIQDSDESIAGHNQMAIWNSTNKPLF